ncbi:hypothetical protein [Sphingobium yanoikuyae]
MTDIDHATNEKKRLDDLAARMIAEATSTSSPNVLSASGYARENISIVHQQRRTTNLAWALSRTGRVSAGTVVGIVGASFSGLMLATILAMVDDAIVYLFEKEHEILPRFRDKAHRHLSPVLNSRALGKGFDPHATSPQYRSPVFAWAAGRASDVAAFWANEFELLADRLPIFSFFGLEIRRDMLHPRHDGVDIDFATDAPDFNWLSVDLLIDATGPGEEENPLGIVDHSYWDSGHRLIYEHFQTPARVLVSGCGDSGVIEALHYAIKDFQHSHVTALWDAGTGLEAAIDLGLVRAKLDGLLHSGEPEAYDVEVLSELVWWYQQRHARFTNPVGPWPYGGEAWSQPILDQLDELMEPHYLASGRTVPMADANPDALEDLILELPLAVQLEVRKQLRGLVEEWISQEMQGLGNELDVPPRFKELEALARPGVEIVLNGLTPTAYTRQLSPFNIWVMRLLLELPAVSYRQGAIVAVAPRVDKRLSVTFADGSTDVFDRVVTRYGPGGRTATLTQGLQRNTQEGDDLLNGDLALTEDPRDASKHAYVDAPRAAVAKALDELDARSASPERISKRRMVMRIALVDSDDYAGEPVYEDGIAWLARELRAGRHPSYDGDTKLIRHLTRR